MVGGVGAREGHDPTPTETTEEAPPPRRPGLARGSLATWFLVVAGALGLFLVLAVPPTQGIDEPNHFSRVWTITSGDIVDSSRGPGQVVWIYPAIGVRATQRVEPGIHRAGELVPACVQEYLSLLYTYWARHGHSSLAAAWRTPAGCAAKPPRFVVFENTAIESPVSYLPEVVGVGLLRLVRAPLPLVFFGGRLTGLLAYLVLVWLALRLAPRGNKVLFVVGAMPMAVQEAAAYSADGMTIALALLAVALALRCLDPELCNRRVLAAFAVVVVGLGLTKPSYALVGFLILLVPSASIAGSRVRALALKCGVVVLALGATAAWYAAVRHVTLAAYFPPHGDNPSHQIRFAFEHTGSYLAILWRSFVQGFGHNGWLAQFVSQVGFYLPAGRSTFAPLWVVVLGWSVLGLAYVFEAGRPVALRARILARAGFPVVLFVVAVVAVFTTLWVEWTPIGFQTVRDLQGRYLLPLVALPVVTLAMLTRRPGRSGTAYVLVVAMTVLAAAQTAIVLGAYY